MIANRFESEWTLEPDIASKKVGRTREACTVIRHPFQIEIKNFILILVFG